MTNHYDELSVSPDRAQAEELRQRLHARMAGNSSDDPHGRSDLHPDTATRDRTQGVAPIKEISVSATPTTDDRIYPRRLAAVAAVIVVVAGVAGIVINSRNSDPVSTPTPPSATTTPVSETSDVPTSLPTGEAAQAMDDTLYKDDFARIQVSATGNYVALRRCRTSAVATCGTGWAYIAGVSGSVETHAGLLGEAGALDLQVLNDRYFVASQSAPDSQAPSAAWLIDATSGEATTLSWSDQPTTLNSPEQKLLLCQDSYNTQCAVTQVWDPDHEETYTDEISSGGSTVTSTYVVTGASVAVPTGAGLPKVVDTGAGTIQPLFMPDNVVATGLNIAQHGTDRIWVGTDPEGAEGLALGYSDDGGATWSEVALPEQLRGNESVQIAADGDRVAAVESWGGEAVYVSNDAGQHWTTATAPTPEGNGAHLYVLADGRLVLMWSLDTYPIQLLVSIRSGWADLETVADSFPDPTSNAGYQRFSVNRAGIAIMPSFIYPSCGGSWPCPGYDEDQSSVLGTSAFSTDLVTWSTTEALNE